jgi:hypothetical protein
MFSVSCLLFLLFLLSGLATAADLYKALERQSKPGCFVFTTDFDIFPSVQTCFGAGHKKGLQEAK